MSVKSERELSPNSRNQWSRAKDALATKHYDYAINLLQAVLKEEPLFLEGRQKLRAAEINKFQGLSKFQQQMVSMKVASAAMKLTNLGKKEPGEQLAIAEEVLALDPFHVKANTIVSDAGVALGELSLKALSYETLAKAKPTDKVVLNKLATTYMEMRDAQKAINTFERILEIDPRDGDALSGRKNSEALLAQQTGGWEKAGGSYRDALKDKGQSEQLEAQSKIVKSQEAITNQIAEYFAKHEADPNNGAISKAIAQLYVQKNDYANAIPWYVHAFEAGGRVDTAIEKIIGDMKLRNADQELTALTAAAADAPDPEAQQQYAIAIEQKKTEIDQVRLEQAEARVRAYPNDGEFQSSGHLSGSPYLSVIVIRVSGRRRISVHNR